MMWLRWVKVKREEHDLLSCQTARYLALVLCCCDAMKLGMHILLQYICHQAASYAAFAGLAASSCVQACPCPCHPCTHRCTTPVMSQAVPLAVAQGGRAQGRRGWRWVMMRCMKKDVLGS
jgi:hypothetical protein